MVSSLAGEVSIHSSLDSPNDSFAVVCFGIILRNIMMYLVFR